MSKKYNIWLIPILCMAIITPLTPWLDMKIARFFYDHGMGKGDIFVSHPFLDFLYEFGVVPAQIASLLSALVLLLSYALPTWKKWRSPALVLFLTMVIGAGFIVHTIFKDHWGRPRPRQVIEFGGHQEFRPFYKPNFFHQPEPSKAFPCGHCTMGFYFFAFGILALRYKRMGLMILFMSIAVILGILLGLARMAQGAHFLSDVLMSGLIMWLTALTFDWLICSDKIKNK